MKLDLKLLFIGLILVFGLTACSTSELLVGEAVIVGNEASEVPADEPLQEQPSDPAAVESPVETQADQSSEAIIVPEGAVVFTLVQDETEARFTIGEILRGEPQTVVGVTSEVSGAVFINFDDLAATKVGVITVQADTLRTDNNFRNRAIRDFILQTGRYPEIIFKPTAIEGLPAEVNVGDSFRFDLTGDLTIRDITQQVTFNVEVTAESDTAIRGLARTTVLRQDFDLNIPSVPQVAGVEPQVILELEFLATR